MSIFSKIKAKFEKENPNKRNGSLNQIGKNPKKRVTKRESKRDLDENLISILSKGIDKDIINELNTLNASEQSHSEEPYHTDLTLDDGKQVLAKFNFKGNLDDKKRHQTGDVVYMDNSYYVYVDDSYYEISSITREYVEPLTYIDPTRNMIFQPCYIGGETRKSTATYYDECGRERSIEIKKVFY